MIEKESVVRRSQWCREVNGARLVRLQDDGVNAESLRGRSCKLNQQTIPYILLYLKISPRCSSTRRSPMKFLDSFEAGA